MRFGMMAAVGMLAATAGMAHGERESGKPWSVPDYYYWEAPIVLAQAALPGSSSNIPKANFLFTDCQEIDVESRSTSAERVVDVPQALANFLEKKSKQPIDIATIKVEMVESTQRGKLVELVGPGGAKAWAYDHEPGYEGKERAVFMAEYGGKRYKIVITIYANAFYTRPEDTECPPPRMKKLNSRPDSAVDTLAGTTINVAPLEGNALAETTGSSITLDTNAAGYGWYIDYTPYLNDEYLPTSNPKVWVAKAGSEAAGKTDMLSVLLHEYGHALGLEQSN